VSGLSALAVAKETIIHIFRKIYKSEKRKEQHEGKGTDATSI
jgi:hypothetical protein